MHAKKSEIFLYALAFALLLPAVGKQRDDRGGFPFEVFSGDGTSSVCNGAFVEKRKNGTSLCEFSILSAAHCFDAQTSIKIDGVSYEVKEITKAPKNIDISILYFETACNRFTEDRIYSISTRPIPERAALTVRKSLYWNRQPSSLGYGANTPSVAGKQVRGIVADEYEGQSLAGYRYFRIAGKDTIESGDSGSPIFLDGEIVGVLSGSNQRPKPPFSVFLFSANESMEWVREKLRVRYLPMRTRR